MRMTDLKAGWAVIGNDGRDVGSVRDVGQNYVRASAGALVGDLYIPASAIANVENEAVYLNVAQRDVAGMGWGQPPRDEDTLEASPEGDLHRHV
jgi:hypothetical protein